MGSCFLNADKEGKHNLEAVQLKLSPFVCNSNQVHADSNAKIFV
jgi:hypothetical protein